VKALVAAVKDRYARCDVLVNNAGMNMESRFTGPEYVDAIEKVMAVNFFGTVYCTAEFLELLESSAPSNVVNITSVAGRLAVGASAYTASKFALVGWSESLYYELAERGIYVSSVEPGFISTEGFPQTDLKRDRFMRYALGSVEQVSAAVQDAIVHRKMQRVVPRWYYSLGIPRLVFPAMHRYVIKKLVRPMAASRSR
jgi:short-subunit dehydrogenase